MTQDINESMFMNGGNSDSEKAAFKLGAEFGASLTPAKGCSMRKYFVLYESDSGSQTAGFVADGLDDCYKQFEEKFGKPEPQIIDIHSEPICSCGQLPDKDLVMWDAINGDFYEHENLDGILKDLKENYCDSEEGIHPDIESIQIFKEVADVVVEKVEGKDTHRVKVVPRSSLICNCEGKDKRISELENNFAMVEISNEGMLLDLEFKRGEIESLKKENERLRNLIGEVDFSNEE